MKEFCVETPVGIIKAIESPDKDNPGIVLMFLGRDGREMSACSMQYMEDTRRIESRMWGKDDPDGEPVASCGIDLHLVELCTPGMEGTEKTQYTVAELELAIRDGSVGLGDKVLGAWVDDTEVAAATVLDVAEWLRQNYDFRY